MSPLLLPLLLATAAPGDCDEWIAGLAAIGDEVEEWAFTPGGACKAALDEGLVNVDDVLRMLPVKAQPAALCRLGSTALDDARLNFVDDAALTVRERGTCLAVLVPRHPEVLTGRSFLHDPASGRPRVSPVVVVAAREAPDRAAYALVLERAISDRALDRWNLGDVLCEHPGRDLRDTCRHIDDDKDAAAEDAVQFVYLVGAPVVAGAALVGAAIYVVAAVVTFGDDYPAVVTGAVGGAFFVGFVGAGVGFIGGAAFVDPSVGVVDKDADTGANGLPFLIGVVTGAALGVVVGGVAGAGVAFSDGVPRGLVDAVGVVGVGATVAAVGGLVVVAVAAEVDAVE